MDSESSLDELMKPLVFLHGFLGSTQDWQPLISQLPTTYDVYRPSIPGHDNAELVNEPSLR